MYLTTLSGGRNWYIYGWMGLQAACHFKAFLHMQKNEEPHGYLANLYVFAP